LIELFLVVEFILFLKCKVSLVMFHNHVV